MQDKICRLQWWNFIGLENTAARQSAFPIKRFEFPQYRPRAKLGVARENDVKRIALLGGILGEIPQRPHGRVLIRLSRTFVPDRRHGREHDQFIGVLDDDVR